MAEEFKLKGIDSLLLNQGELKEVEVEGIEDAKVLLTMHAGKPVAVGPKCTHFGAPLVKGVVSSDGHITCPWHGACFSLSTGDVEDAPALDPIAKFEVVEKDGAVYVKGEKDLIKAGRYTPDYRCAAAGGETVVIVGGGSGATGAYEQLRKDGFTGKITIISAEAELPFDRTKLSKALIGDISKLAHRSSEFYKQSSIDIVKDEATKIDFTSKTVETKDGSKHPYTQLILASGGVAKSLPLPGLKIGDLKNVFLLRTIQDVQGINAAVGEEPKGKKIVVIGSSFIGLEVANALAGKGAEVHVVGMESAPAQNAFGIEVGKVIQGILEKNGVKFHLDAGVEKATPASDGKSVGAVHLKGGVELPAEVVIEGVGVKPSTQYFSDSEGAPELQKDGSILVDSRFKVEGLNNVYAIGDIATFPYNNTKVRIEHWNVAQNAGRTVGKAIAKPNIAQRTFVPVFWSALGTQLRYCGHPTGGFDDVVIQGETSGDKLGFAAYYIHGEDVVAVATMQKDPIMVQTMELMRKGRMLKAKDIRGGADVMSAQL